MPICGESKTSKRIKGCQAAHLRSTIEAFLEAINCQAAIPGIGVSSRSSQVNGE